MFNKCSPLILIVLFILQGCSTSENTTPVVSSDIQAFSGVKNFWSQEEADKAIEDRIVGHFASQALVPLIFNDMGHLLTPAEYNAGIRQVQPTWETHFTDLTTFRNVMTELIAIGSQVSARLETATKANVVQLPANETGTTLAYVYDPYQLVY